MAASDAEIEEEASGTVAHAKRFVLRQKESSEKRVASVYAAILIGGTIIWGFGGLLKCVL